MATVLTDSQKVTVGPVSAVDAKGNAAPLGGALVFSASNANVTLAPSADGLSCDVIAGSTLGDVQLSVTDGVLTGTADFTVIAGAEASLSLPVGAPVAQ